MNNMNKKVVLPAAFAAAVGFYLLTPSSDTPSVDMNAQQKVAPSGYILSRMNNPVPEIEAKTFSTKKSFFISMKEEEPKNLYRYGLAFVQYLNDMRVREKIINGKPTIRFADRNANNTIVELTPPGLLSGLNFSGKTNFKREQFDQLSYGALSEWLGVSEPDEIGRVYFNENYANYTGFKLALLDFQRQIVVTRFKLNTMGFGYQSVSEEYIRLHNTYLSNDEIPSPEELAMFEGMVMKNVKNIANFAGGSLAKQNKKDSDKVALLLIEYFIYEDVRLLNSLKTDVKINTPVPDDVKIEKRLLREQKEAKARERASEEARKKELLERRTGRR